MTTYRTTSHSAGTNPAATGPKRGRAFGLLVPVIALALLATGCTGGPGDEDDFVDVLTVNDNFTDAEASCIAEAVFDEYGEDGDALGKISGAESYEFLLGEDGVEGFDEFFTGTVSSCTTVGPSLDG